jgi:hypothetical protein
MTPGVIAILFGIGVGGWVFDKASHHTGNNARTSVITAAFVGLIAAFVFFTLFRFVIHK